MQCASYQIFFSFDIPSLIVNGICCAFSSHNQQDELFITNKNIYLLMTKCKIGKRTVNKTQKDE